MALHVIPVDGAAEHQASTECRCQPTREEGRRFAPTPLRWHGVTYTHHLLVASADARRAVEALP